MATKKNGTMVRAIKETGSKRNPEHPGWNGSQFILEGGINGRSIAYVTPDEMREALPAAQAKLVDSDPVKVFNYLRGKKIQFAFVITEEG